MEKTIKVEKFTQYRHISVVLRTLAKKNSLDVFNFIKENPSCVVETITAHLQKTVDPTWSQPETSTILASLREGKLVETHRDGKFIQYKTTELSKEIFSVVEKFRQIYN